MLTRAIMIQGTGSNVGKSMLVAGLCRAALRRGISVAPFKPQNMSNNAAVTHDGGEIGRAQALQAIACGRSPSVHMNPVLLKPETDTGSQVVIQGRAQSRLEARDFGGARGVLLKPVLELGLEPEQISKLATLLRTMSGQYDQAARSATAF